MFDLNSGVPCGVEECPGHDSIVWNICVGLLNNHSTIMKVAHKPSQCSAGEPFGQSTTGSHVSSLFGFETHRQWPRVAATRGFGVTLKPYIRHFESRVNERFVTVTTKHSLPDSAK